MTLWSDWIVSVGRARRERSLPINSICQVAPRWATSCFGELALVDRAPGGNTTSPSGVGAMVPDFKVWLHWTQCQQADQPLPQCVQGQRPRPTNNSPGVYWSCIGVAKHAHCIGQVHAMSRRNLGACHSLLGDGDNCRLSRHPSPLTVQRTENVEMPKPKPPTRLQGPTTSPAFQSAIRTPQQPGAAALTAASMFAPAALAKMQPVKRGKRGERGR
jgi:hypothetical protein